MKKIWTNFEEYWRNFYYFLFYLFTVFISILDSSGAGSCRTMHRRHSKANLLLHICKERYNFQQVNFQQLNAICFKSFWLFFDFLKGCIVTFWMTLVILESLIWSFETFVFIKITSNWIAHWNNDLCYIFWKWVFPQNGILAALGMQPCGF